MNLVVIKLQNSNNSALTYNYILDCFCAIWTTRYAEPENTREKKGGSNVSYKLSPNSFKGNLYSSPKICMACHEIIL